MFEPAHGSAPDIARRVLANPVGATWSASMMLDHLDHPEAATELMDAVGAHLRDGSSTHDMGETAGTTAFTKALPARLG
ncbi:hypothetical protein ABA31_27070 [Agrococcus baldri]|uniref:Isopropylmalate dehydrogenase-like domain-containing protein n=1 Tax=Agrococcus baldri TaxID=153730 RepID=A0AA87RJI5_9MICO|nr:isocitrate/isopropylmalate family dehydrogenase [Agrococcus baldri]GEK81356.1 hypothetical protein ABA31_27070 [Agrococcus baldri]